MEREHFKAIGKGIKYLVTDSENYEIADISLLAEIKFFAQRITKNYKMEGQKS